MKESHAKQLTKGLELDAEAIRKKAREELTKGAVTTTLMRDAKDIVALLSQALATELVCTLRYRQNAVVAEALGADVVAKEFWEHADQELDHGNRLAKRISLLGGTPDFNPDTLSKISHADYYHASEEDPQALEKMIEENLVAERIAVETYREMARLIGDADPVTRRLLEEILEDEEEHADELAAFYGAVKENRLRPAVVPAY